MPARKKAKASADKPSGKSKRPSKSELEAMADAAGNVIGCLAASGTGQSKLDCIREVIRPLVEQAEKSSDRKTSDEAIASARLRGRDLAIQAGRDSGWGESTIEKSISLTTGDDSNV